MFRTHIVGDTFLSVVARSLEVVHDFWRHREPTNEVSQFGGTLDFLGQLEGRLLVLALFRVDLDGAELVLECR